MNNSDAFEGRNCDMSRFGQASSVHRSMVQYACGRITNRRRSPLSIFMIPFLVLVVAWLLR
jgi:hypothetical protein